tara:strand:+ start:1589 stop:2062 length:474 start_codon:yes stop_codon:yes gene_type:complete
LSDRQRIIDIVLDEKTVVRRKPEVEHERAVAIFDLIESNSFAPVGHQDGPYRLKLSISENRLIFHISTEAEEMVSEIAMPLRPFRRIVKDYFLICESYYDAIRTATPSKIEAIDMGRRGLHNDGSVVLQEQLNGKIDIDFDTARRLFTLICVLHIRG